MVRGAIERLWSAGTAANGRSREAGLDCEQVQRVTAELTYAARQIMQAAGVAVYLQAPGEQAYRATFSWDSDHPIPHATTSLPRAFHEIAEHGRTVHTLRVHSCFASHRARIHTR